MALVNLMLCVESINFMLPRCNQRVEKSSFSFIFAGVAKVVPLFACSRSKPVYLEIANGTRLAIIYAPDAVVGARAATPAIAGVVASADP
jgi:hypothetical protein